MKKTAVFPGSFDPITIGHHSIILKALPIFDEIIVAVGDNTTKKYMFDKNKRLSFVEQAFSSEPKVRVESYNGLTVEFCKKYEVRYILRGLRNAADFEFEKNIAHMNHAMDDSIETVFFVTDPGLSPVSSTIVREIIKNNGDVAQFLPPNVMI